MRLRNQRRPIRKSERRQNVSRTSKGFFLHSTLRLCYRFVARKLAFGIPRLYVDNSSHIVQLGIWLLLSVVVRFCTCIIKKLNHSLLRAFNIRGAVFSSRRLR